MLPEPDGARKPAPALSIVVPVYRNADTLAELSRRLKDALADRVESFELILVNDACPDGSLRVIEELTREHSWISFVALEKNRGQQQAILYGLRSAAGSFVAVMDADLQDPPEALPLLYQKLQNDACGVVFAARIGNYQSAARMLTSRIFKWLLSRLTGLPRGAGCYVMMSQGVKVEILRSASETFFLPAAIAGTGSTVGSLSVARDFRPRGRSSYSTWRRAKVAAQYMGHLLFKKM